MPRKDAWLTACRVGGADGEIGIGTAGRNGAEDEMLRALGQQMSELLAELPAGTEHRRSTLRPGMTLVAKGMVSEFGDDDEQRHGEVPSVSAGQAVVVARTGVREVKRDSTRLCRLRCQGA